MRLTLENLMSAPAGLELPAFREFPDVYIALGLLAIIAIAFLIYRLEILPRKSLPFIIGSLLAILGLQLFKESRRKGLQKKLESIDDDLKNKESQIFERLKKTHGVTDMELQRIRAEIYKDRNASAKALLLLAADTDDERRQIEELSGDALENAITDVLKTA